MSQTKKTAKKRVAVFFGGRSPEHDVSIVTSLQVLVAVDQSLFEAFPVYIAPDGEWLIGDILRDRSSYFLDKNARKKTVAVTLDVKPQSGLERKGVLLAGGVLHGMRKVETFDVALPAFHGLYGEDGNIQGLFELAGIPYGGMRTMASSILMDKGATKKFLRALDIPHLPYVELRRPAQGYLIAKEKIAAALENEKIGFPCIIKPAHLGSSIGVAKAENIEEIIACLPGIFEFDATALIEPCVQNLIEYNVAVARINGAVRTSAIERPKSTQALLDFRQKYLSGSKNKSGSKSAGETSQGMLSLTRELNPALDQQTESHIREWASRLFEAVSGTGAPRIDFMLDGKTGALWFNEVNPWPGSTGYFLWEAAQQPLLFTELLTALIEEALAERRGRSLPADPVPQDARLFKRPV